MSSYDATKRLGWISTLSRRVLLARYLLRALGEISDSIEDMNLRHTTLLRAMGTSLIALDLDNGVTSRSAAPYYPKNRPTSYAIKARQIPRFNFQLDTGPTPAITILLDNGKTLQGTQEIEIDPGEPSDLLSYEIDIISRGTNLSSKRVTTERGRRLRDEPLWESIASIWARNPQVSKLANKTRRALRQANRETNGHFDFWVTYYDSLVKGEPLDPELLRNVASISPSIWSNGHEAVAAEIKHLQAALLARKLPQAEVVEINPDTGDFRAIPIPLQNIPLLSALFTNISDSLEDAIQGTNGLSEQSSEFRKITRATKRYGNDPQQAEMTLTAIAKGLRRQIHETKYLPDSEDNLALLEAVEEGVRGIRANHPEVAANREQLARQAFSELDGSAQKLLEEAQPILVELSEGSMAEDFAEDIPSLVNDSLLPLPTGAPPLPGTDAATRVFSRTSKMALLREKILDHGSQLHDSQEGKTLRVGLAGTAVGDLLYRIVRLGLQLLGVI
ncbi:hypothetical protein [Ruegeria atlantica]|uniref:hypothetical protein n=1 Tax=Ruegeria atlantica TaxID=81569 RepID=UPI0020C1D7D1|nr:hypothetical protein [Ruegeria atlantica]